MRRGNLTASLFVSILVAGSLAVLTQPVAAADEKEPRNSITIGKDGEFDAAHGVRSGSGTAEDPYVISGWRLSSLHVHDTDRYFVVRDNEITSRLVLNWTGDRVKVVDNVIGDLRVNQNVPRTGMPTSGLFARNKIDLVGQLRHFDGIFERNVVGSPDGGMEEDLPFFDQRAVNFDGFNGARFRNNTVYGYMDVKIHGHHHGSGFGEGSHDHSAAPEESHDHSEMSGVDHTQRYHQVWVTGNKIYSTDRYALGFNDSGHRANDRTAASEDNEALNLPHVHYTRVHLNGNELIGAGLEVNIFNSSDELHEKYEDGFLEIKNNSVKLSVAELEPFTSKTGISVYNARFAEIRIEGNSVEGTYDGTQPLLISTDQWETGIQIDQLLETRMYVLNNRVSKVETGLSAWRFERTQWWLKNLVTETVETRMQTDESAKRER